MQLPKELTTVTPLSKALAMILFVTLPFIGFLLGVKYQALQTIPVSIYQQPTSTPQVPTSKEASPTEVIPTNAVATNGNLTTYRNNKYQYSVGYPNVWKMSAPINEDFVIISSDKVHYIQFTVGPSGHGCGYMGQGPTPVITSRMFLIGTQTVTLKDDCFTDTYSINTFNKNNEQVDIEFSYDLVHREEVDNVLKSIKGLEIKSN